MQPVARFWPLAARGAQIVASRWPGTRPAVTTLAVLSEDYFAVPDERVKSIESVLTVVNGAVVYAAEPFRGEAPPPIPVLPEWSPLRAFGGYGAPLDVKRAARAGVPQSGHTHNEHCHSHGCGHALQQLFSTAELAAQRYSGFFGRGCDCFAF